MENKLLVAVALFATLNLQPSTVFAQGSAFTYQGRLNENGAPVNRTYDLIFRPFNAPTGGTALALPFVRSLPITNGLFTVALDFPSGIFNGNPIWLEIQVSTNGFAGIVSTLTPRQPLTPAPYAIFSGTATTAATATTATTVPNGAIGSAQLANNVSLGASNVTGRLDVYRTAVSTPALSLIGSTSQSSTYGDTGREEARVQANSYGGRLTTWDSAGNETAHFGSATDAGGSVQLFQKNGALSVNLQGDLDGANGGGFFRLFKGDGSVGLTLQADLSGESKITTQVLQITGGSDLSEQFDIAAPKDELAPGMIVCIDPEHPGQLVESTKSYDRTVAGVMSGAGGVKPGMLMGQQGTPADGKHPVALSGRVYCEADASNGAIHPGDLLTTSDTPGHAMKVTDYDQAHGAIIGKAMSSLGTGQGLVLVLVSLQ
jgi:hypothetical protein